MVQLGYDRDEIERSLEMERYDETWAAYHLLGLPFYAVSFCSAISIIFIRLLYTLSVLYWCVTVITISCPQEE